MKRNIMRGDIYYTQLYDGIGSEQRGHRPVLIIQNDIGNKYSPTTIAAALTSRVKSDDHQPTHVKLDARFGLSRESLVMLEQIFTIDQRRLEEYVGSVRDQLTLSMIDKAIAVSFALKEAGENA